MCLVVELSPKIDYFASIYDTIYNFLLPVPQFFQYSIEFYQSTGWVQYSTVQDGILITLAYFCYHLKSKIVLLWSIKYRNSNT
jgi:hypothetical protein